jgi:RNA polymerase sigma factor (sigma-70 family)
MKIKLSEQDLIAAIQNRDRIGAEALYDMYSSNLFKVIYSIVKHQEVAEDTLQQTILKVWNSFDQYHKQKGRLYTWMVTIARNLSKDALRSKAYHNESNNSDISAMGNDIDMRYQTSINIDVFGIKESLLKLKGEHQEVMNLIYYQGYTHVEVADALGIPVGTVKTRWTFAISRLRSLLATKKER